MGAAGTFDVTVSGTYYSNTDFETYENWDYVVDTWDYIDDHVRFYNGEGSCDNWQNPLPSGSPYYDPDASCYEVNCIARYDNNFVYASFDCNYDHSNCACNRTYYYVFSTTCYWNSPCVSTPTIYNTTANAVFTYYIEGYNGNYYEGYDGYGWPSCDGINPYTIFPECGDASLTMTIDNNTDRDLLVTSNNVTLGTVPQGGSFTTPPLADNYFSSINVEGIW